MIVQNKSIIEGRQFSESPYDAQFSYQTQSGISEKKGQKSTAPEISYETKNLIDQVTTNVLDFMTAFSETEADWRAQITEDQSNKH